MALDEIDAGTDGAKPDSEFVHPIQVLWGDCDPALIAYTGRIPCFALEAIDAWWAEKIGYDWYSLNVDRNVGTPFVHLDLDFRSPVTPRHKLLCDVALVKFGRTAMTFRVVGRQDDKVSFEGNFVCVAVTADTFTAAPPPADIHERLAALVTPLQNQDQ